MQAEQPVEFQHALARSGAGERQFAAHAGVVSVTVGRCERQPVHGAAQDDEDESRVRVRGGERQRRAVRLGQAGDAHLFEINLHRSAL